MPGEPEDNSGLIWVFKSLSKFAGGMRVKPRCQDCVCTFANFWNFSFGRMPAAREHR